MKRAKKTSLKTIRNLHKEIRKIEKEIQNLDQALTEDQSPGYWSESSLYSPPEDEKKKPDSSHKPAMDFIVPWQMK